MECQEIKDRFSSLLEGELLPGEEKEVRDHLSSCSECQRDVRKFEKTIHWLHSVEEVEVPEGFLSEVHEKLEERKRSDVPDKKRRWGLFPYSSRVKLPIQAVAMVAVLFLVIYVTKMKPVEMSRQKEIQYPQSSLSEDKKAEPIQPPSGTADVKGVEQPKAPLVREERADKRVALKSQEMEKDAIKPEISSQARKQDEYVSTLRQAEERAVPGPKMEASQPVDLLKPSELPLPGKKREEIEGKKDVKGREISLPENKEERALLARRGTKEEGKAGSVSTEAPRSEGIPETKKQFAAQQERKKGLAAKEWTPSSPAPHIKEIVLKISDRDQFLTQFYDLVSTMGGDVVQTGEDILLASVPAGSLPRFEKELGVLSRVKEPPSPQHTPIGKLSSVHVAKSKEVKDKEKEAKAKDSDKEPLISIRIRLIQK